MVLAVAGEKCDALSADFADGDAIARRAVWRFDPRFAGALHQRVKARPTEHADIGAQLTFHGGSAFEVGLASPRTLPSKGVCRRCAMPF